MRTTKRYLTAMFLCSISVAFFLGGAAYGAASPLGTWDIIVSGAKVGSANLTFNDDGTVTGYFIVIPGTGSGNAQGNPVSFGSFYVTGLWQTDGNQVVGFLFNDPSETVRLDVTSFWGTAAANGTSITLTGVTVDGTMQLSGVPLVQFATLPGTWTIEKETQGQTTFTEIFAAAPDSSVGGGNLYDLGGLTSDKCVFGYAALSRGNILSISFEEFPMPSNGDCLTIDPTTPGTVSAGVGKINLVTDRATLAGYQGGSPSPRVVLQVLCQ